jgi:hypothetical protein
MVWCYNSSARKAEMNIVAITIAVVIVIVGVVSSNLKQKEQTQQIRETQEVTQKDEVETSGNGITPSPTHSPTPKPPTPTPTITSTPQQSHPSGELRYPNAKYIRSEGDVEVYESQDDPDAITQWYKGQIQNMGLGIKSFITTKTNDNVLNKLVGADGGREVRIEITRTSGSSTTEIKVSVN